MKSELFQNVQGRLNWFYDNVTNKKHRLEKDLKNKNVSVDLLAEIAVSYAKFPSVNHSCKYLGRQQEAKLCFDSRVKPLVRDFILAGYKKGSYDMDEVYSLIVKVKELYRLPEYSIQDYTIGNAQKLVSISFKFFFTLLDYCNIRPITNSDDFMGYNYCVIDRIVKDVIINDYPNIKKSLNFDFKNGSWSSWDDIQIFKSIQKELFDYCHDTYDNNVFYELLAWVRKN